MRKNINLLFLHCLLTLLTPHPPTPTLHPPPPLTCHSQNFSRLANIIAPPTASLGPQHSVSVCVWVLCVV